MSRLQVPPQITLGQLTKVNSFSPAAYASVQIPNSAQRLVSHFLDASRPYDRGTEPGSAYYVSQSPRYLIRTKALQPFSNLPYPKGDSLQPVNPRIFVDLGLRDGDILLSKDSNVGECCLLNGDDWQTHMISSGIVRLNVRVDRYYLYAFLKHPVTKEQLRAFSPRGATIRHARDLFLKCSVPIPTQAGAERVTKYVEALVRAAVDKEAEIRARHASILATVDAELSAHSQPLHQAPRYPTYGDLLRIGRMDTGLYCSGFQEFKERIETYEHGCTTLSDIGVESRRGPNLAVSVIGKSLYSDQPKPGWYRLILPTNISPYGTVTAWQWLGNSKCLRTIRKGDLVLGCEGFRKGRSLVMCDEVERCTTNFHGTVLYWPGADLREMVFLRCYLAYSRHKGAIDWIGVGGSGGHFAPSYFDYLPIPRFPDAVKVDIAQLYHCPAPPPADSPLLSTFVEWHRRWNAHLGIWELDRGLNDLRDELNAVLGQIINGDAVTVPLP